MIQIRISKPRTFRSKHIKGIKGVLWGGGGGGGFIGSFDYHYLSDLYGSLILIWTIEMECTLI